MKKGLIGEKAQEVLSYMRADGERWPNLGEAFRRLDTRKKIRSRVLSYNDSQKWQIIKASVLQCLP